jgi:photosystem II stability/assembly factor-like uncharacterized protein
MHRSDPGAQVRLVGRGLKSTPTIVGRSAIGGAEPRYLRRGVATHEGRRGRTSAVPLLGLLIQLLGLQGAGQAGSARAQGPEWEPTGLSTPINRLISAADGTLFAVARDAVLRSDDGAETWTPLQVPDGTRQFFVDPVAPAVLYAWSPAGLHKSEDGAASWRPIFPQEPPSPSFSVALTVSPADPRLLYLAVIFTPSTPSGSYRLMRSQDGGESWEEIGRGGPGQSCYYEFPILQAHPTDPGRVFRASGCTASRDFLYGLPLRESVDRGAAWTELFAEKGLFPMQIVGGSGAAPDRYYLLAVSRSVQAAGTATTLYRSDAGGSWTAKRRWCCADSGPVSLLYEPDQPDRVYVIPARGGINASLDGGETWTEPGERGLVDVRGMAIRPDAAHLFAATGRGVFRLPLR